MFTSAKQHSPIDSSSRATRNRQHTPFFSEMQTTSFRLFPQPRPHLLYYLYTMESPADCSQIHTMSSSFIKLPCTHRYQSRHPPPIPASIHPRAIPAALHLKHRPNYLHPSQHSNLAAFRLSPSHYFLSVPPVSRNRHTATNQVITYSTPMLTVSSYQDYV